MFCFLSDSAMEVPTFRPSEQEFSDFESYMGRVSAECRRLGVGLAKVVPPASWRAGTPEEEVAHQRRIVCPVQQRVTRAASGAYRVRNIIKCDSTRGATFKQWAEEQEKACAAAMQNVDRSDPQQLRTAFWQQLGVTQAAVYGADSLGSLFRRDLKQWNLNTLPSLLRLIMGGANLPGVTNSYLYFGMWKAMFAAHTEDMDLYSINYVHMGAPKIWYATAAPAAEAFEQLAASIFPAPAKQCSDWLRHKTFVFSPQLLEQHNVPYCTGTQYPGEFMVTFPRAYHWGFNAGFNVAEAVNFALEDWIPFGKQASFCLCKKDSVRIDMEVFLFHYIRRLRGLGKLPPPAAHPEWRFKCICGMEVTSEDPEMLWPCKPQFACDDCGLWVHVECNVLDPEVNEQAPAYCYLCQNKRNLLLGATESKDDLKPALEVAAQPKLKKTKKKK